MQSLTEDVNRQVERERALQLRYGQLQEQIAEIQEAHIQAQQYQQMQCAHQGAQIIGEPQSYAENGTTELPINNAEEDIVEQTIVE